MCFGSRFCKYVAYPIHHGGTPPLVNTAVLLVHEVKQHQKPLWSKN